jgi:CRP-like cAMP-binding protein
MNDLKEIAIFRSVPEAVTMQLATAIEVRTHPAGAVVVREGRMPTHLSLIWSGRLDVTTRGEGDVAEKVNELGTGDHFGEVGLLEGMPSTATVTATSEVELWQIPAAELLTAARNSSELLGSLTSASSAALARSHPTYNPAAVGADPQLTSLTERLRRLPASERHQAIREINQTLDAREQRDP